MTRLLALAALASLALVPTLRAQSTASSTPTIQAESNGEVQLPTGGAPSVTVTTTCPRDAEGSRCVLWIEPVAGIEHRPVQWQLTKAGTGCTGASVDAFHDVVEDPDLAVAQIAKGSSCTLTFAFRLKDSLAPAAPDVVRNVSLFVTTPE